MFSGEIKSVEPEKTGINVEPSLVDNTYAVFQRIVAYPENAGLINDFREAYEYRSQFPSTGEHGQLNGEEFNGLAYAVRSAMAFYTPSANLGKLEESVLAPGNLAQDTEVDEAWNQRLLEAVEEAVEDETTLEGFYHGLEYSGHLKDGYMPPESLSEHLKRALRRYSNRSRFAVTDEYP